jgi:hypothetical protein
MMRLGCTFVRKFVIFGAGKPSAVVMPEPSEVGSCLCARLSMARLSQLGGWLDLI